MTEPIRVGKIVSVRGSVVDVEFESDLPSINTLLRAGDVRIEVWSQQGARRVRGIALTSTQGLARGTPVQSTGGPLKAPVGKAHRPFAAIGRQIVQDYVGV